MIKIILAGYLLFSTLGMAAESDIIRVLNLWMKDSENSQSMINNCIDPYNPSMMEYPYNDLLSDAKKYLESANQEARMTTQFNIRSNKIFMIFNAPAGNGCCAFFTDSGSYINSVCRSETSDWQFSR